LEPNFDKGIELLKITLLSEELRASHFTKIGLWLAILVALIGGDLALLGVSDRTEVTAFVALFFISLLFVVYEIRKIRSEYDGRLAKLGSLIKTIEAGRAIGDFDELLKKLRE
jgi:hypothetical protein